MRDSFSLERARSHVKDLGTGLHALSFGEVKKFRAKSSKLEGNAWVLGWVKCINYIPFSHNWPTNPAGQSQMNRLPFSSQFSRQVPPLRHGCGLLQQRLTHWVQGDWLWQGNIYTLLYYEQSLWVPHYLSLAYNVERDANKNYRVNPESKTRRTRTQISRKHLLGSLSLDDCTLLNQFPFNMTVYFRLLFANLSF